jgi:hypothetical protein
VAGLVLFIMALPLLLRDCFKSRPGESYTGDL